MTLVNSPCFGTLAMLHVDDGAEVAEGDDLCEIEAMKTLTRVYATANGTVSFLVELGEIVGEGDPVAEIS